MKWQLLKSELLDDGRIEMKWNNGGGCSYTKQDRSEVDNQLLVGNWYKITFESTDAPVADRNEEGGPR